MGDMLFLRNGAPQIERFHGSFISEEDVEKIVADVRRQDVKIEKIESFADVVGGDDEMTAKRAAGAEVRATNSSTRRRRSSLTPGLAPRRFLQRRLNLGYARAGRIMDQLQEAGIVAAERQQSARRTCPSRSDRRPA